MKCNHGYSLPGDGEETQLGLGGAARHYDIMSDNTCRSTSTSTVRVYSYVLLEKHKQIKIVIVGLCVANSRACRWVMQSSTGQAQTPGGGSSVSILSSLLSRAIPTPAIFSVCRLTTPTQLTLSTCEGHAQFDF